MRLTAKGEPVNSKPFEASTPSFQAEAMSHIMLDTFEDEIDALISLLEHDRKAASSEALIRRYATAEEVFGDIGDSYRRIELKMIVLSDKLTEGFMGGES
jgi:hypothetical protein